MKPFIEIKGYENAMKIMGQLSQKIQKRMISKALRRSAKPMLAASKTNAPRRSGNLISKIRMITMRRNPQNPSEQAVMIAPAFDFSKNGAINAYYGHFVHYGTSPQKGRQKKSARGVTRTIHASRGIKPNPFLQKAYDATNQSVIDNFGNTMAVEIENFTKRNFNKL